MKKIIKISFIILILLMYSNFIFASTTPVIFTGDLVAKPNETKTLKLQVSSEKLIGVVSGKIVSSDNIKIDSITAKNNWVLTYNEETKEFNVLKAEGSNTDEILEIKYTTGTSEGDTTITITGLQVANTEYQEEKLNDITATIKVQSEQNLPENTNDNNPELVEIEVAKAPNKTTYKVGEKFDSTGLQVMAKYSDGTKKDVTKNVTIVNQNTALKSGDSKIEIKYTENGITKSIQQTISVVNTNNNNNNNNNNTKDTTDNSKSNSKLPQTGVDSIIIFLVPCLIIISIVSYFMYNRYKGI